ncbi:MAG: antitermination protein NusB [Desulfuromonas sp.]|nr:MAG: antitermination protein NusB [Desulfuromonas sp.]
MEYLFIWLALACAAYSLAKGKGRNEKLWFGIGLLIGPFAALLLAFMPATPEAREKNGYS